MEYYQLVICAYSPLQHHSYPDHTNPLIAVVKQLRDESLYKNHMELNNFF
jgi:hypothetical protein